MTKFVPTFPVPVPSRGINALESEAEPGQFREGYDVVDDGSGFRRRDAFKGVAAGGMFFFPPGRTSVLGANQVVDSDRRWNRGDYASETFYVGCNEQFDGFHVPVLYSVFSGALAGVNCQLELHYWSGAAFTAVPWFLDETVRYNELTAYANAPIGEIGGVHWRTGQLTGWALSSLASLSRYWIRARIIRKDTPGAAVTASPIAYTIQSPGIRAFIRPAINGMFYASYGDRRTIVIGNDRSPIRGNEKGGMLSLWTPAAPNQSQELKLSRYQGAGILGTITYPNAGQNGSSGSAGSLGGGGGAYSVTNYTDGAGSSGINPATPLRELAVESITPSAPFSASAVTSTDARLLTELDNAYESYIIECTARTGVGPAVAEFRIISSYTNNSPTNVTMGVSRDWSAVPDANNRFNIYGPFERLKIAELAITNQRAVEQIDFPILNTLSNIYPLPGAASEIDEWDYNDWVSTGQNVTFSLRQALRWMVHSGKRWRGCVPVTRELVLTNGGKLLSWDGFTLKYLESDYQSEAALTIIGKVIDQSVLEGKVEDQSQLDPKTALRPEPPAGDFVVEFGGRIFVARDKSIYWSMAYGANNIWPYGNELQIRDQFNDYITGLIPFGDRLYITTPTSIHVLMASAGEGYSLNPVTQGLGFVDQDAIDYVRLGEQLAIMGVTLDGVYLLAGGQPQGIISNWAAIEPNGVNTSRLHKAVACAWNTEDAFLFAYPSRNSDVNDRIGYINVKRKSCFVWRHSDGVTALSVYPDSSGREVLLIGTEEGIVETLVIGDTDDGRTITGYARTHPIKLDARQMQVYRTNVVADALGAGQTLTIRLYKDRATTPAYSAAVPIDQGGAIYGTGVYGTATYAEDRTKTKSYGIAAGVKAGEIEMEVRGTARWRLWDWNLELRALGTGRK